MVCNIILVVILSIMGLKGVWNLKVITIEKTKTTTFLLALMMWMTKQRGKTEWYCVSRGRWWRRINIYCVKMEDCIVSLMISHYPQHNTEPPPLLLWPDASSPYYASTPNIVWCFFCFLQNSKMVVLVELVINSTVKHAYNPNKIFLQLLSIFCIGKGSK